MESQTAMTAASPSSRAARATAARAGHRRGAGSAARATSKIEMPNGSETKRRRAALRAEDAGQQPVHERRGPLQIVAGPVERRPHDRSAMMGGASSVLKYVTRSTAKPAASTTERSEPAV